MSQVWNTQYSSQNECINAMHSLDIPKSFDRYTLLLITGTMSQSFSNDRKRHRALAIQYSVLNSEKVVARGSGVPNKVLWFSNRLCTDAISVRYIACTDTCSCSYPQTSCILLLILSTEHYCACIQISQLYLLLLWQNNAHRALATTQRDSLERCCHVTDGRNFCVVIIPTKLPAISWKVCTALTRRNTALFVKSVRRADLCDKTKSCSAITYYSSSAIWQC